MSNVSIADLVNHWVEHGDAPPETLIATLMAREQAMADMLRQAGMQFGMFPQIVAEVLAQIEMGEPISNQEREMIRFSYNTLMEQIAAAQRGEGPMPQP